MLSRASDPAGAVHSSGTGCLLLCTVPHPAPRPDRSMATGLRDNTLPPWWPHNVMPTSASSKHQLRWFPSTYAMLQPHFRIYCSLGIFQICTLHLEYLLPLPTWYVQHLPNCQSQSKKLFSEDFFSFCKSELISFLSYINISLHFYCRITRIDLYCG